LENVGQTHRLEVILREAGLPANVDDIPTDDKPEVAPEPEPMHFTDADWYSFYDFGLFFTDMLARGGDTRPSTFQPFTQGYLYTQDSQQSTYGPSISQPFTHGYPHTHDTQPYGPLSSVPVDFEYDISVDYQYGTPEQPVMENVDDDTPEQPVMEHVVDDDPLFDTLPLALRRAWRVMHPRVRYTPRTWLSNYLLVISYGFYLSLRSYGLLYYGLLYYGLLYYEFLLMIFFHYYY
jgi:hypothetical protein